MTSSVGPSRAVLRRSAFALSVPALAILVASCSSGPTTHADTSTSVARSTASTTSTTATTATSNPASETQTAVLNAWESAEQTLYGYLQEPWQQDRADLVGGGNQRRPLAEARRLLHRSSTPVRGRVPSRREDGSAERPDDLQPRPSGRLRSHCHSATVTGCIYDTGTTTGRAARASDSRRRGRRGAWHLESQLSTARGRSSTSRRRRYRNAERPSFFDSHSAWLSLPGALPLCQ